MGFIYNTILGLFLYFPEDKTEYIPAGITCVIFIIGAVFAMRLIIKISKKEELKTKQLEEDLFNRNARKEDTL